VSRIWTGGPRTSAQPQPVPRVDGHLPPHDLDAEAAVLSAILLSADVAGEVLAGPLAPEHFYADANGRIFEAVAELSRAEQPVDIVSVASWLRDRGRLAQVGGPSYLAQLADATPAVAHVDAHARIVLDKWRLRSVIAACQRIAATGYGDVGADVEAWVEGSLATLRVAVDAAPTRAPLASPAEAVDELVASWDRPAPYAPTGIAGLDRMLSGGLRAGNVLALAGAAKAGKSALAGQILYDAAGPEVIGIYASVEMPRPEVWARFVTREAFRLALVGGGSRGPAGHLVTFSDVYHGTAYRRGRASDARAEDIARLVHLNEAVARARSRPNLYVENLAPGSTPTLLRTIVRRARDAWALAHSDRGHHRPLCVLVIDPIQRLFAAPTGSLSGTALERINADEIARMGQVAQQLKVLADSEGVAIVFPSDGTKTGAAAGPQEVTDLRGNYQLNHLATTILGLHSKKPRDPGDPRSAARALAGGDKAEEARVDEIMNAMPGWWSAWARSDEARRLGPRPVAIDCSGNRQADAGDLVLGFVRGACAFVERDPGDPGGWDTAQAAKDFAC
jgi:replicative DNA helicase